MKELSTRANGQKCRPPCLRQGERARVAWIGDGADFEHRGLPCVIHVSTVQDAKCKGSKRCFLELRETRNGGLELKEPRPGDRLDLFMLGGSMHCIGESRAPTTPGIVQVSRLWGVDVRPKNRGWWTKQERPEACGRGEVANKQAFSCGTRGLRPGP